MALGSLHMGSGHRRLQGLTRQSYGTYGKDHLRRRTTEITWLRPVISTSENARPATRVHFFVRMRSSVKVGIVVRAIVSPVERRVNTAILFGPIVV